MNDWDKKILAVMWESITERYRKAYGTLYAVNLATRELFIKQFHMSEADADALISKINKDQREIIIRAAKEVASQEKES